MSKSMTMSKSHYKQSQAQSWKPHDYQKKAVKWLLEHAAAALFLDPGLGKTSVTYAAFSFLHKRKVAGKMLVIAPIRACHQVWPAEAELWKDFNHLKVVVLHGKHKEQLLNEDADVYVINPEGLEWLIYGGKGSTFDLRRWRKFGFDTLVIDELTKFKHSKGVRFKALKKVLHLFARRWGLTGSPAANGLLDLFGQCYVLDEGNALGRFITHYRLTYFTNPDGQGWKWVPKPGAKELIYDRLKPLALRMAGEDYLELPEIVDLWDFLELPPKARAIYDALEDDLVAKIEDKVVVAANAASAGTKLWQVCNGGLYVDDDVIAILQGKERGTLNVHDVKTDWLEDLINELQGQPLLVAYQFQHDLERLLERFGKGSPTFGKDAKKNKELEAAWNANEIPYVFGQQDSIAHALNLQRGNAAHLALYSMTWNFETYDQLLRRIRRQGNKAGRVFRHHAVIRDSTDEDRRYALGHKDKGQKALFEALTTRRSIRIRGRAR